MCVYVCVSFIGPEASSTEFLNFFIINSVNVEILHNFQLQNFKLLLILNVSVPFKAFQS
jgi:hypothetical protein